jgi:hypothetical protein
LFEPKTFKVRSCSHSSYPQPLVNPLNPACFAQLGPLPEVCPTPLISFDRPPQHHSKPSPVLLAAQLAARSRHPQVAAQCRFRPAAAHKRNHRPLSPTRGARLSSPTCTVLKPDSGMPPCPPRVRLLRCGPHAKRSARPYLRCRRHPGTLPRDP